MRISIIGFRLSMCDIQYCVSNGMRDDRYSLSGFIKLDEAFFTSENSYIEKKNDKLKAGVGSQRKARF